MIFNCRKMLLKWTDLVVVQVTRKYGLYNSLKLSEQRSCLVLVKSRRWRYKEKPARINIRSNNSRNTVRPASTPVLCHSWWLQQLVPMATQGVFEVDRQGYTIWRLLKTRSTASPSDHRLSLTIDICESKTRTSAGLTKSRILDIETDSKHLHRLLGKLRLMDGDAKRCHQGHHGRCLCMSARSALTMSF
jgi:hypothetical protein